MKHVVLCLMLNLVIATAAHASQKQKKEAQQPTPLDQFIERARQVDAPQPASTSLFSPASPNLFLFRDIKARSLNDIVTIQIIENAAASNSANTSSQKKTDINLAAAGFNSFDKAFQASSALNFDGQGSTTRSGQLQASLTARVSEVLPNGDLVIEGTKDVTVNRERQSLAIRGVIRTRDINPNNVVLSTAISHMEVKFDGKGIVSDANKPGFLYWLLSKISPF
jgi:flagellar L-ring protein precursor FlgH